MQHAGGLAFFHLHESLLSQIHCHICCASLVFASEGYFPSLSRETRGGWQEIINSIFHLASFTTRQRTICEVIQGYMEERTYDVRNAIKMLPNEQLRRERQRRGWSREYVAEQIGVADPKTIGRWERGVAFPSSFFLQKLCNLFGMLAQDLGLFTADHDSELQAIALKP